MLIRTGLIVAVAALGAFSMGASASTVLYADYTVGTAFQEAQESAFQAATGPLTLIDFEDLANGTVLAGNEYAGPGALLSNPGGFDIHLLPPTGHFIPRSGANALFPVGDAFNIDERLQLELTAPQHAVGLWLIDSEFPDVGDTETVEFFDASDQLILSIAQPRTGYVSEEESDGNFFVGLVSSVPIAKVVMNEGLFDIPSDEDVGWDDIQFGVPEPGALPILMLGSLAILHRRR